MSYLHLLELEKQLKEAVRLEETVWSARLIIGMWEIIKPMDEQLNSLREDARQMARQMARSQD